MANKQPKKHVETQFKPGNKGGPGNPHGKQQELFRAAIIKAATEKDVQDVVRALLKKAKKGDVFAAQLFLDRVCGKLKDVVQHEGGTQKTFNVLVAVGEAVAMKKVRDVFDANDVAKLEAKAHN